LLRFFVLATVFVPFVYFLQFLYYRLILPFMIISLILRIISPILGVAGYRCIRPETKSTAAGLLIAAGAIAFLTVGGIILIMAGALVASWEPEEYCAPSPVRVKPEDWKRGNRGRLQDWGRMPEESGRGDAFTVARAYWVMKTTAQVAAKALRHHKARDQNRMVTQDTQRPVHRVGRESSLELELENVRLDISMHHLQPLLDLQAQTLGGLSEPLSGPRYHCEGYRVSRLLS